MRKITLILGILVAILGACSTYNCPTYSGAKPIYKAKTGINPVKPITYREYIPLAYGHKY